MIFSQMVRYNQNHQNSDHLDRQQLDRQQLDRQLSTEDWLAANMPQVAPTSRLCVLSTSELSTVYLLFPLQTNSTDIFIIIHK